LVIKLKFLMKVFIVKKFVVKLSKPVWTTDKKNVNVLLSSLLAWTLLTCWVPFKCVKRSIHVCPQIISENSWILLCINTHITDRRVCTNFHKGFTNFHKEFLMLNFALKFSLCHTPQRNGIA
jgi:hypothetical protein